MSDTPERGWTGTAGYDPDMLLALLIYAYCQGVRSSRKIERRCWTDVAFRVLCAQDTPDHATIARFRAEHEQAFGALFSQVVEVAATAGLVRLGTVAIDGTKIPANASIDANRGRGLAGRAGPPDHHRGERSRRRRRWVRERWERRHRPRGRRQGAVGVAGSQPSNRADPSGRVGGD